MHRIITYGSEGLLERVRLNYRVLVCLIQIGCLLGVTWVGGSTVCDIERK